MTVSVLDIEYRPEYQVWFFMYDRDAGLIGACRSDTPDLENDTIGVGETYRKARNDLLDMELK